MDKDLKSLFIVGAYATSPNLFKWNERVELVYFNKLKDMQYLRGLEIPIWGESLHPYDNEWFLKNLSPNWENILTCVPGTMKFLEDSPLFGLSSKDKNGRKKALNMYKKVLAWTKLLKSNFGEDCVKAISLTSSPTINSDSILADKLFFFESLNEIISWDWGKTKILVEHCDAYSPKNKVPKKGFLPIEQEIEIIKKINHQANIKIELIVNWGRSAIEYKSVEGPINHVKCAYENEILAGIIFSGTSADDKNLYGPWSDMHMPPALYKDYKHFESTSLMSFDNMKSTLKVCDHRELKFLGIKLLSLPKSTSIDSRVELNQNAIFMLKEVLKGL